MVSGHFSNLVPIGRFKIVFCRFRSFLIVLGIFRSFQIVLGRFNLFLTLVSTGWWCQFIQMLLKWSHAENGIAEKGTVYFLKVLIIYFFRIM